LEPAWIVQNGRVDAKNLIRRDSVEVDVTTAK
jgi:hypothetical protein